jgi:hypothetical protein
MLLIDGKNKRTIGFTRPISLYCVELGHKIRQNIF